MSAGSGVHPGLAAWHAYMAAGGDPETLRAMLADDAVFHSPVVHSPQEGRDKVFAYLHAASHVLGGDNFRYLREIVDGELARIAVAVDEGVRLGLRVNAGHGLHYTNVQPIAALPGIKELNIGHAIVAHAVFVGWQNAVREMKAIMVAARLGTRYPVPGQPA